MNANVTITHQLTGQTFIVPSYHLLLARAAWKAGHAIVINGDGYTIEIPRMEDACDPTSLILDGVDYIHAN